MIEQGSPEWFEQRRGKVTASRISDVMAKLKNGKPAASRDNYLAQLVTERLTQTVAESFTNAAMQWGTECEPLARSAYEAFTGAFVEEVPMIDHPFIAASGASPDGLVGDNGLIEIKCPNTATHIQTLLGAAIDTRYIYQMQWQMACTKRQWCDFVSFDPRMPGPLQLFIKRVEADEELIEQIQEEVCQFLVVVDSTVEKLQQLASSR